MADITKNAEIPTGFKTVIKESVVGKSPREVFDAATTIFRGADASYRGVLMEYDLYKIPNNTYNKLCEEYMVLRGAYAGTDFKNEPSVITLRKKQDLALGAMNEAEKTFREGIGINLWSKREDARMAKEEAKKALEQK